ncbi:Phosphopantetheine attachment site [Ferrimonas sediminum]|uniref:Phosphopantetheine attachment site n=1 Tax=Ferrimonas sediminum TaxID=718193 RepID=A0A1G8W528_9GAMM|nr:phosphopantetheine-binding protein [Ferrimonas sediminum]SDJ73187.1 Phosphopantetheine attachment site [Ferrimonas sediminum]
MNREQIQTLIIEAIQEIAPEIEREAIDPLEDIREECDMDSMDFLTFLTLLKNRSGVSIPERDYPLVDTFDKLQRYLDAKLAQNGG